MTWSAINLHGPKIQLHPKQKIKTAVELVIVQPSVLHTLKYSMQIDFMIVYGSQITSMGAYFATKNK